MVVFWFLLLRLLLVSSSSSILLSLVSGLPSSEKVYGFIVARSSYEDAAGLVGLGRLGLGRRKVRDECLVSLLSLLLLVLVSLAMMLLKLLFSP
ncbi:hypothetical protein F5Y17DRAFT_438673 [Xylariaceae sp. FL0594]|nr:hypothetical protein F5Y17DRAFT_438673 [Xylariaceae sp. FL0594]